MANLMVLELTSVSKGMISSNTKLSSKMAYKRHLERVLRN